MKTKSSKTIRKPAAKAVRGTVVRHKAKKAVVPSRRRAPIFVAEIRALIDSARQRVAVTVNAELTLLNWQIGRRINAEVLKGKRAEYGKEIIETLSQHLTEEYGKGWGIRHLWHCLRFAEAFEDRAIVNTLCTQFSWSHFRLLTMIDEPIKREFYIEIGKLEHWSVRQMQERIQSMLFERTAISKKPEATIRRELSILREEGSLSPDLAFRDPYILDFLGLGDSYSEKDLETSILNEMQRFLTELGSDFAFLSRQKRITIDNRDYYIDLLFYHRRLKRLVVLDLKLGEFDAAYKGEMELYLRYLEKHEAVEGENSPIGMILCTGKNKEHVELLHLNKSNIHVADYLTALPSQKLLKAKLHQSLKIAQTKMLRAGEGA